MHSHRYRYAYAHTRRIRVHVRPNPDTKESERLGQRFIFTTNRLTIVNACVHAFPWERNSAVHSSTISLHVRLPYRPQLSTAERLHPRLSTMSRMHTAVLASLTEPASQSRCAGVCPNSSRSVLRERASSVYERSTRSTSASSVSFLPVASVEPSRLSSPLPRRWVCVMTTSSKHEFAILSLSLSLRANPEREE